jgi:methylthioribose-1-phosphate isomerase
MRELLLATARAHVDRDRRACFAIGEHGAPLLPRKATVLTHCNAGALATAGYGTALGVIRRACELGHDIRVLIDETRPVLQGARLTAWEMVRERIPAYLITDNMAASFMRMGRVDAIVVGADRIARNGDTANKIGTYGLAVLAKYHKVPFYVAAPMTTIDYSLQSGRDIVIEQRPVAEVKSIAGFAIAPDDIEALNPAFDVTPAELITKIITDRGVADPSDLERWSPEQKA